MERKEIARRLLAGTNDVHKRVEIMLAAELGEELVAELPSLIKAGLCQIGYSSTPVPKFRPDNYVLGKERWHVTLDIDGEPLCFAGLMEQYGTFGLARTLLDPVLRQPVELGQRGNGRMAAVRSYMPESQLRKELELDNFAQHLWSRDNNCTSCLPVSRRESTRAMVPPDRWLHPVIEYLRDLGIDQAQIDAVLLATLGLKEARSSIEKVVSIVGAYRGDKHALQHVLILHEAEILRLQLKDAGPIITLTKHLAFLVARGFGFFRGSQESTDVLVCEISDGNIGLVLQHYLLFADQGNGAPYRKISSSHAAEDQILKLVPAAFAKAMQDGRYGIAAALAQLDPGKVTSHEEALHALEMAIVTGQPIRLNWQKFVLPPNT